MALGSADQFYNLIGQKRISYLACSIIYSNNFSAFKLTFSVNLENTESIVPLRSYTCHQGRSNWGDVGV
jgi:hypothetical protein